MQLLAKFHEARTALSHRRIERRAFKQLSDELAAFTTEADRNELDLILARHSDAETREIRTILSRQAAEPQFSA